MKTKLPIDELNTLEEYLTAVWQSESKPTAEEVIDEVLDILVLAYVYGNNNANSQLGGSFDVDPNEMQKAIYKSVGGKTFEQRVAEYVSGGTVSDVILVADTEMQRVFNHSALFTAVSLGATTKTWKTRLDDKVRDTHDPLENITIPIAEEFVTWDNDSALCPGGFTTPQNNCNCRCWLQFSY